MEVIGVFCLLTLYFGFTLLIYMYSHVGISLIQSIEIHSIAFIIITFTTFFILAIHEAILFYNQWHEHYSKSIRLEKILLRLNTIYSKLKLIHIFIQ